MTTVDIHKAKTLLSHLVEEATKGKSFIIAKTGKPMVKVTALDAPTGKQVRRLGFLRGRFKVPEDFNNMGRSAGKAMRKSRDSTSFKRRASAPTGANVAHPPDRGNSSHPMYCLAWHSPNRNSQGRTNDPLVVQNSDG
jgi:antitoxin (DNA-binding transcriptional repressor) of toxin-antitoxin stability system